MSRDNNKIALNIIQDGICHFPKAAIESPHMMRGYLSLERLHIPCYNIVSTQYNLPMITRNLTNRTVLETLVCENILPQILKVALEYLFLPIWVEVFCSKDKGSIIFYDGALFERPF